MIEPESGFDAVADVAIAEGRVAEIGIGPRTAPDDVNVSGLVVTALRGYPRWVPARRAHQAVSTFEHILFRG